MRSRLLGILALLPGVLLGAPPENAPPKSGKPGPYITVYHDDATSFQVRSNRIVLLGEGHYIVWLRWLWANPFPWKSRIETARMIVAEIDCRRLQVRETMVMHKDREGNLFDIDERELGDSPWKALPKDSGAAAALGRVCELVPELLHPTPSPGTETTPPDARPGTVDRR